MAEEPLKFRLGDTNLYYEVPSSVLNPPRFDVKDGRLRVLNYGFLPSNSVITIDRNGDLVLTYDYSGYSDDEMAILSQVKAVLGISDDDILIDSYLFYYLRSTERFIENYCALKSVPKELMYVWLEMLAAKARANMHGFASLENTPAPSSIKDGSQSVTYASGSGAAAVVNIAQDDAEWLSGWGPQLRQFRRFKWG